MQVCLSVAPLALALPPAIGIGALGVGITVVAAFDTLVNVHTNWANVSWVGMEVAAVLKFAHFFCPGSVPSFASA